MSTTVKRTTAGVTDDAVLAATGRTWSQWLSVLDKDGARDKTHADIASLLHDKHGCSGWWSQMVAVGYEQERGLRDKHQQADGYSISRSKTIAVAVSKLYQAWDNAKTRRRWLADPDFHVRTATAYKSMRIDWVDGASRVEVYFASKDKAKSHVSVQHRKLDDAEQAETMKAYWAEQLDKLKALLEH
jgi:uncharacterized protein YndB with AHSA1/START domain